MVREEITMPHKLALSERKQLTMSGVSEVMSFDDTAVVLRTALGVLYYEEPRQPGGWLRRLFG